MRLDFLADARKPCVPPNASASAAPRLGDPEVVMEIVAGQMFRRRALRVNSRRTTVLLTNLDLIARIQNKRGNVILQEKIYRAAVVSGAGVFSSSCSLR
jgi:hypothetical protein